VAKDSPRITDGELQTLDEYWGQKKNFIPYIISNCLEGFKKKPPCSSKNTPAYLVVRHDWNFKRDLVLR